MQREERRSWNHARTMRRRVLYSSTLALLVLLGTVGSVAPKPVEAWDKDAHYYLVYYLAVATCFEPDEAYLIAMGAWSVDTYPGTSPLPTYQDLKSRDFSRFISAGRNYHALGEEEEVQKRYQELRNMAFDALANPGSSPEAALIKFGVYLHYRQDMYSHKGYKPPLGHALATILNDDPDSLATNPTVTRQMVNTVIGEMIMACMTLHRAYRDPRSVAFDNLLNELIKASDPAWKRQRTRVALVVLSELYGAPMGVWGSVIKYYNLAKIFKAETRRYHEVLNHNMRRLQVEYNKVTGMSFSVPQTVNIDALLSPRGSRVVLTGRADPVDVAILLDDEVFAVTNDTFVFQGLVTIYNSGDTATAGSADGVVSLMDGAGNIVAVAELPGRVLNPGEREVFNVSISVPLDVLPDGYVLLYGAAEGGNEDLYFYNNVFQLALNASEVKEAAALAVNASSPGAAGAAASTTTVTETEVSTTTVTVLPNTTTTVTVTTITRSYSRTIVLPGTGRAVNVDTLILLLVVIALALALARGLARR